MEQIHKRRTRRRVEAEIVEATRRREHAIATLDLDAYTHLTEHIDDLVEERARMMRDQLPGPRPPAGT